MMQLPDKLSELLNLAIDDCEEVEKKSDYTFYMHSFIDTRNDICTVCMAGAILVNTLKINLPKKIFATTLNFRKILEGYNCNEYNKLLAIDYVRCGLFSSALRELDSYREISLVQKEALSHAQTIIHKNNLRGQHRASWAAYRQAAAVLAEVGL